MKNINMKFISICLFCFMQIALQAQMMTNKNDTGGLTASDESISIYPNPVKGEATVSFFTKQEGYTLINAFGIDGKKIISLGENLKEGKNSFQLSLPKGTYVIQINGNGFSYSTKVISQSNSEIKPEIVFNESAVLQTTSKPLKVNSSSFPILTTSAVTSISYTTATCGGDITENGGSYYVINCGVCWNTSSNPTLSNNISASGSKGATSFIGSISGLSPATTYFVRAYATNTGGYTSYGNELSFTTLTTYPTFTISPVFSISATMATVEANVISGGNGYTLYKGVCWSTSPEPTTANSKTTEGSAAIEFKSTITGLSPLTTYYLRAYAFNTSSLTGYSSEMSFTTPASAPATIPTLTTPVTVYSITTTSAQSTMRVDNDGGAFVTARGVCWSTTANPTIANTSKLGDTGAGTLRSLIMPLTGGTTYYLRAFATNSVGTGYSSQVSFTTLPVLPTITTSNVTSITSTTATSGATVNSDGGATVTARGICWSTTAYPTTANSKTTDGTGTGSFESSIGELTLGNTYYVRAYATNSVGTAYGPQVSFKTALAVGDSYEGGKVACIFVSGDTGYDANVAHGLLAFPSDALTWSTWDGAVTACYNHGGGWRLPNINELKTLFDNKDKIGEFATVSNCYYWSSTPDSTQPNYYLTIWFYTDGAGATQPFQKAATQPRVRAVKNY